MFRSPVLMRPVWKTSHMTMFNELLCSTDNPSERKPRNRRDHPNTYELYEIYNSNEDSIENITDESIFNEPHCSTDNFSKREARNRRDHSNIFILKGANNVKTKRSKGFKMTKLNIDEI